MFSHGLSWNVAFTQLLTLCFKVVIEMEGWSGRLRRATGGSDNNDSHHHCCRC